MKQEPLKLKELSKNPFKIKNKMDKEKEVIQKIIVTTTKNVIVSELFGALNVEFEKLLLKTKDAVQAHIRATVLSKLGYSDAATLFNAKANELGYVVEMFGGATDYVYDYDYHNNITKHIIKRFTKPTEPVLPIKRNLTPIESNIMFKYFSLFSFSNIDATGKIVLGGGKDTRGIYYITEEDLLKLVGKDTRGIYYITEEDLLKLVDTTIAATNKTNENTKSELTRDELIKKIKDTAILTVDELTKKVRTINREVSLIDTMYLNNDDLWDLYSFIISPQEYDINESHVNDALTKYENKILENGKVIDHAAISKDIAIEIQELLNSKRNQGDQRATLESETNISDNDNVTNIYNYFNTLLDDGQSDSIALNMTATEFNMSPDAAKTLILKHYPGSIQIDENHKQHFIYSPQEETKWNIFEDDKYPAVEKPKFNTTALRHMISDDAFLKFSYHNLSTGDEANDLEMIYNTYVKGEEDMLSKLKTYESYTARVMENHMLQDTIAQTIIDTAKEFGVTVDPASIFNLIPRMKSDVNMVKSWYALFTPDTKNALKEAITKLSINDIVDKLMKSGITVETMNDEDTLSKLSIALGIPLQSTSFVKSILELELETLRPFMHLGAEIVTCLFGVCAAICLESCVNHSLLSLLR